MTIHEEETMGTPTLTEVAEIKQRARASWAAGDFPAIAKMQLWSVGPVVVDAAHVSADDDVLDVACGTGNAAIRAAERGARVVGVDLTPELFVAGRAEAAEAGVVLDWVEGDAEALPFEDDSFDVVLSTFGCMFAPRHAAAAAEIGRVLRPGGRLAIASWTPDGALAEFFQTMGKYMPPPPPNFEPPVLWGAPAHIEALFDGSGIEFAFTRGLVDPPPFESAEEGVEFMTNAFGPLIMARRMTEESGRWPELHADLLELYGRREPGEYLLATGARR
jgi:SAM-dependent methyltransferase